MISRRDIKRKLSKYYQGEISLEGVEFLKCICENVVDEVIKQSVDDFQEINSIREKAGVRPYKRFNSKYLKYLDNPFKSLAVAPAGKIGDPNRNTILSKRQVIT